MHTIRLKINRVLPHIVVLFVLAMGIFLCHTHADAASSSVKIRYNGKTYLNTSKKMTVKYDKKTVSQKSYKAILIKKNYMVPYDDVFLKGVNATCKYTKKDKMLTIATNGVTLKMTVGQKKAYCNDKEVTLPVSPLSVRYISKKKTRILVPVNYIAKTLNLSYKKSGSTIYLGSPLLLNYDGKSIYYTDVQGNIYYNHKLYTLNSLPAIKISGKMYLPAEEVLDTIMGLDYTYQSDSGELEISNADLDYSFVASIHSTKATRNGKNVTLTAPVKVIRNGKTQKNIVCIPASTVLGQLNYARSWNKKNSYYEIQSKEFFHWAKTLTSSQSGSETNYIHEFYSFYENQGGTGAIKFQLTGSNADLVKTATVNRDKNVITITLPKSKCNLDRNVFHNFGEIIQKMEITENESSVTISFTCENVADYSYIIQNKVLEINILYTYGTSDGSVTGYSLAIPKPQGVTIADVTNHDLYKSKKFEIIISGNYVSFFKKNPIVINNSSIKKLTTTKSGKNTVITVTTSSLKGYKIYESGNNFHVKIGSPKKIYKKIVVLDAGHGGHDPGAQSKGTNEKDLTHKILYTLMKDYFSGNAPDIKVYWTRTNDSFITLANRAAFAKSVGADAFISLHMNYATKGTANGTEVFYSVSNNRKGFGGITSQKMANLFRTQLLKDLHTTNRGTKTAGYYVLKHNTVPSILIELGFLSGSTDYSKLTNGTFQKKAAKSIYTGIVSMFKTYPTGR